MPALTVSSPTAAGIADELEKQGFRVLAVAAGPPASVHIIGLISLSDPPRNDSTLLISELKTLGVRTVMVTGDAPATAGHRGPCCWVGRRHLSPWTTSESP